MLENLGKNKKRNPFFIALIVGLLYFIFYNITRYATDQQFDFLMGLFGAAIFFVVYFFLQGYINKKLNKKEIKKTKRKKQ